jgi:hypothetical protein
LHRRAGGIAVSTAPPPRIAHKNQNFAASIGLHAGRFFAPALAGLDGGEPVKTETPLAGLALAA